MTESDATDDPPPQQSVAEAVRARGHQTLWDYLRANPGVPMVEVAETLDAAPAVVLFTTYAIGNVLAECREDFIALGMPLTAQARARSHAVVGRAVPALGGHAQTSEPQA